MSMVKRVIGGHKSFSELVICLSHVAKVVNFSRSRPLTSELSICLESSPIEGHCAVSLPDVVRGRRGHNRNGTALCEVSDGVLNVVVVSVNDDGNATTRTV